MKGAVTMDTLSFVFEMTIYTVVFFFILWAFLYSIDKEGDTSFDGYVAALLTLIFTLCCIFNWILGTLLFIVICWIGYEFLKFFKSALFHDYRRY